MSPELKDVLDLARYFISPEDSESPHLERRCLAARRAKALFWILAAICLGLTLARLH